MAKCAFLLLIVLSFSATVFGHSSTVATPPPIDTIVVEWKDYKLPKFHPEHNLFPIGTGMPLYKYRTVQTAVPLMVAGGLLFGNDVAFRDMRNSYLGAEWRYHYDDYVQYAPAAIMVGLKAFGVHGRSSWGRMTVSSAFAVVGTVLMSNGTKLLRLRERPDGADSRSFPSGHTATAFVTATLLHKEYGTTISPWFSVAGYGIAAGVGVSRVMNNKHWVSDVLAGAGVGILAGELGYFLADKIFRGRGLLRPTSEMMPVNNIGRPSFMGLSGGAVVLPLGKRDGHALTYRGVSTGVHGAWFVNSNIGFGGQLSALNARYNGTVEDSGFDAGALLSPVDIVSAQAGVYLSKTIGNRWLLSGKLLGGATVTRASNLSENLAADMQGVSVVLFPNFTSFTATAGGAITYVVNNNLGVRAYADIAALGCCTTYSTVGGDAVNQETTIAFPLTLGVAFDILLW
jgi:membrane-associated phospholipid phosphatase